MRETMTEKVQTLLQNLKSGSYKDKRSDTTLNIPNNFFEMNSHMKSVWLFREQLLFEEPYFHEYDRFGFNRSKKVYAPISLQTAGNITPDYETALEKGLEQLRREVEENLPIWSTEQKDFGESVLFAIDAALEFAERYRKAAKDYGITELYEALCQVPHKAPRTLYEALVFMKFIIFTLRCNGATHITFGRFDQYLRPYYENDLKSRKTREELLELVEEFFISINYDGDLYPGIQQGDNGQSMVLGGCNKDGIDAFCDFSKVCMEASLELQLIDPKINLRVNKNTPIELLEFATQMTKQGLGFPQYNNDDVVIPGLVKLGYSLEDARNYVVAACWELIVPGKGMDWPNIETLNFPKIVSETVHNHLHNCSSYEELWVLVAENIERECDRLIEHANSYRLGSSPYLSIYVSNCLAAGKDISQGGAVYNNYGFHGAGIATAANTLIAIKEMIFDKKLCSKETLLESLQANFEGYDELRQQLLSCPKMGNNISSVDEIGGNLMTAFVDSLKGKQNVMGGIFRAGTGSAMEYILSAEQVPATADGRKAGAPYGCSFSPALEGKLKGPLSCIQSFTKYDMTEIINGGPLTLEIHSSTFRNEEGIKKVARLVKTFIDLGGHQLQLNAINRDVLLDAKKHPDQYKHLIVRVWGWSGYFIELDEKYQDHIIKRTELHI